MGLCFQDANVNIFTHHINSKAIIEKMRTLKKTLHSFAQMDCISLYGQYDDICTSRLAIVFLNIKHRQNSQKVCQ